MTSVPEPAPAETWAQTLHLYDDPQLYDDQNADVSEDLGFWAYCADKYSKPGTEILELGSGTGRVSLALADLGFKVHGIDISPHMIELANSKIGSLTAEGSVHPVFQLGDICNYSHPERLPLIIYPYNSLCHMTDNDLIDKAFESIRSSCLPDGRFAFTLFVPLPKFLNRDPDALYPVGSFLDSVTGEQIDLFESMQYDRWTQLNHITWYFFKESLEEPIVRNYVLRMFYPQDTEYLLRAQGFKIEERYGDYDLTPISADSVVQAVIARRI